MQFAGSASKVAFRAYALPCLEIRVSRGEISKNEARELIHGYPLHRLEEDIEGRYFPRAVARCAETARRMGLDEITVEAIRQYFRFEHDIRVEKEAKANIIRNPDYCIVWPGTVLTLKPKHADVVTEFWAKEYRTELVNGLNVGDSVTVHRAFVSEKIDRETFDKMLAVKRLISSEGV